MAKIKHGDKPHHTAGNNAPPEKRGASEKPLGRQISMEDQKASRKFIGGVRPSPESNKS